MSYLLIGKANTGKSSIFNLLTSSNYNIVHPEAGTTRDWHKELITDTSSYIYDTPGVLINQSNNNIIFNKFFNKTLNQNIKTFLYVIEYKDGFNQIDNFSINLLRKYNKKILLIINKFDNFKKKPIDDFKEYGILDVIFISCSHNYGIDILKSFFSYNIIDSFKDISFDFSIAIFGKPNAGKSTYLNSLLGYQRALTSPIAGTTSDYVVDYFHYKKKNIKIIDTAGIGRKANIKNKSINFFSVKKSFENIKIIDSAIILIDAKEEIDRQDKRIIKLISDKSKSIILIFNKIDLIDNKENYKSNVILDISNSFSEIKNIKIFFISSLNKSNVLKTIDYLFEFIFLKNSKISTSKLNTWLKKVTSENQHPLISNKKINFKYAVQVKEKPVTIKIFCSYSNKLRNNYKRYLMNKFNNDFKILNQKTKFIFSSSMNPYV